MNLWGHSCLNNHKQAKCYKGKDVHKFSATTEMIIECKIYDKSSDTRGN